MEAECADQEFAMPRSITERHPVARSRNNLAIQGADIGREAAFRSILKAALAGLCQDLQSRAPSRGGAAQGILTRNAPVS
jgi:hypothetical protein